MATERVDWRKADPDMDWGYGWGQGWNPAGTEPLTDDDDDADEQSPHALALSLRLCVCARAVGGSHSVTGDAVAGVQSCDH